MDAPEHVIDVFFSDGGVLAFTNPDADAVKVLSPEQPGSGRCVGHQHVLTPVNEKVLAPGAGYADHDAGHGADDDGLSDGRAGVGKKFCPRRLIDDGDLRLVLNVVGVEGAPLGNDNAAGLEKAVTDAADRCLGIQAFVADQKILFCHGCHAGDIGHIAQSIEIGGQERADGSRAAVAPAGAAIDFDGVVGQGTQGRFHVLLPAFPNGNDRHQGNDADDNAQQGQQGAKPVRHQSRGRHSESLGKQTHSGRSGGWRFDALGRRVRLRGESLGSDVGAIRHNHAVAQFDDALRTGRDAQVVRHDHNGVAPRIEIHQQAHHLNAALLIQCPSGFVSQDDRTAIHQRAGDADPLLLPARELGRCVGQTVAQSQLIQQLPGA